MLGELVEKLEHLSVLPDSIEQLVKESWGAKNPIGIRVMEMVDKEVAIRIINESLK